MRVPALACAAALLGSCTSVQLPADGRAQFDPLQYFAGWSHGTGTLRIVFSGPQRIQVESVGTPLPGGGLRLRQSVQQGDKAPRVREWRIARVGPGRYSGTLTDAAGPVTITTAGPRGLIRYAMKNGMQVRQQLALQADGRTLLNHMTVSKWGVRVARLDETIRKLP